MMLGNFAPILVAIALTAEPMFAKKPFNARSSILNGRQATTVGDIAYFPDHSYPRNRTEANTFCSELGGELAKVNFKVYNLLRFSLPNLGYYWIEGIDKPGIERFEATGNCTTGMTDINRIPPENVKIGPASCLTLKKGNNASNSSIMAIGCNSMIKGVVCAYPVDDGCPTRKSWFN